MHAIRLSLVTAIIALGLFVPRVFAIVGGQVDTENKYSNVGAVVFAPEGSQPTPLFSGTLIHPRVFLTAGHCIAQFVQNHPAPFDDCYVTFVPDVRIPDMSISREIEAVIAHPKYQESGYNPGGHDVGLIILREPIDDVTPVKLAEEGFLDKLRADGCLREPGQGGAPFLVVGYGSTLDWPPPEETPADGPRRFAQTEFLGMNQTYLFTLQVLATVNGGTGFRYSGGPAFWVDTDGSLIQVALTSGGNMRLIGTNVPWRVDIPDTLDFMNGVLASLPVETN